MNMLSLAVALNQEEKIEAIEEEAEENEDAIQVLLNMEVARMRMESLMDMIYLLPDYRVGIDRSLRMRELRSAIPGVKARENRVQPAQSMLSSILYDHEHKLMRNDQALGAYKRSVVKSLQTHQAVVSRISGALTEIAHSVNKLKQSSWSAISSNMIMNKHSVPMSIQGVPDVTTSELTQAIAANNIVVGATDFPTVESKSDRKTGGYSSTFPQPTSCAPIIKCFKYTHGNITGLETATYSRQPGFLSPYGEEVNLVIDESTKLGRINVSEHSYRPDKLVGGWLGGGNYAHSINVPVVIPKDNKIHISVTVPLCYVNGVSVNLRYPNNEVTGDEARLFDILGVISGGKSYDTQSPPVQQTVESLLSRMRTKLKIKLVHYPPATCESGVSADYWENIAVKDATGTRVLFAEYMMTSITSISTTQIPHVDGRVEWGLRVHGSIDFNVSSPPYEYIGTRNGHSINQIGIPMAGELCIQSYFEDWFIGLGVLLPPSGVVETSIKSNAIELSTAQMMTKLWYDMENLKTVLNRKPGGMEEGFSGLEQFLSVGMMLAMPINPVAAGVIGGLLGAAMTMHSVTTMASEGVSEEKAIGLLTGLLTAASIGAAMARPHELVGPMSRKAPQFTSDGYTLLEDLVADGTAIEGSGTMIEMIDMSHVNTEELHIGMANSIAAEIEELPTVEILRDSQASMKIRELESDFTPEEIGELGSKLLSEGYTSDAEGLKAYLKETGNADQNFGGGNEKVTGVDKEFMTRTFEEGMAQDFRLGGDQGVLDVNEGIDIGHDKSRIVGQWKKVVVQSDAKGKTPGMNEAKSSNETGQDMFELDGLSETSVPGINAGDVYADNIGRGASITDTLAANIDPNHVTSNMLRPGGVEIEFVAGNEMDVREIIVTHTWDESGDHNLPSKLLNKAHAERAKLLGAGRSTEQVDTWIERFEAGEYMTKVLDGGPQNMFTYRYYETRRPVIQYEPSTTPKTIELKVGDKTMSINSFEPMPMVRDGKLVVRHKIVPTTYGVLDEVATITLQPGEAFVTPNDHVPTRADPNAAGASHETEVSSLNDNSGFTTRHIDMPSGMARQTRLVKVSNIGDNTKGFYTKFTSPDGRPLSVEIKAGQVWTNSTDVPVTFDVPAGVNTFEIQNGAAVNGKSIRSSSLPESHIRNLGSTDPNIPSTSRVSTTHITNEMGIENTVESMYMPEVSDNDLRGMIESGDPHKVEAAHHIMRMRSHQGFQNVTSYVPKQHATHATDPNASQLVAVSPTNPIVEVSMPKSLITDANVKIDLGRTTSQFREGANNGTTAAVIRTVQSDVPLSVLRETLVQKTAGFSTGSAKNITDVDMTQHRIKNDWSGVSRDVIGEGIALGADNVSAQSTRQFILRTRGGDITYDIPVRTSGNVEIAGDAKHRGGLIFDGEDYSRVVDGVKTEIGFTEIPMVGGEDNYGLLKGVHCRDHSSFMTSVAEGGEAGLERTFNDLDRDWSTGLGRAFGTLTGAPDKLLTSLQRMFQRSWSVSNLYRFHNLKL